MANPSSWIVKGKGTSEVKAQGITLKFYASNGKAMADYTSPTKSATVQVNSREHAVALTEKAVANANAEALTIEVLHGDIVESDINFGQSRIENTCLSAEAYNAVMTVADKARTGLFNPTW